MHDEGRCGELRLNLKPWFSSYQVACNNLSVYILMHRLEQRPLKRDAVYDGFCGDFANDEMAVHDIKKCAFEEICFQIVGPWHQYEVGVIENAVGIEEEIGEVFLAVCRCKIGSWSKFLVRDGNGGPADQEESVAIDQALPRRHAIVAHGDDAVVFC